MRFFEFESKQLFGKHGIPLPTGSRVARSPEEAGQVAGDINGPVVLKSQVLTGGRMKAGGVLFADSPTDAAAAAKTILALTINGHSPRGVLVEARAPVGQEYYVGVTRSRPPTASAPLPLPAAAHRQRSACRDGSCKLPA